jgi:hypothetical protein
VKYWVKWLLCIVDNKPVSKWEEEYVQGRLKKYTEEYKTPHSDDRR